MKLKIGDTAPDFEILDQNSKSHSLSEYRGKWLLLYFYPKDDTEGCTKQACVIRDDFFGFKKLGVKIVGISEDSIEVHRSFADEYSLPFALLSDGEKEVAKLYGVWGRSAGHKYDGTQRTSFLIDPAGKIVKIYENVKPAEHSKEVLEDLEKMHI